MITKEEELEEDRIKLEADIAALIAVFEKNHGTTVTIELNK
jgi:hypothetical protein